MLVNGRHLRQQAESIRKKINEKTKAQEGQGKSNSSAQQQAVPVSKKNLFTSLAPTVKQSSDIDYFNWLENYAREQLKMPPGQIALLHRNQCREQLNDQWTYILSWQNNNFTGTGDTLPQAKKNAAKLAYDYVNRPAVIASSSIAEELKTETGEDSPKANFAPK